MYGVRINRRENAVFLRFVIKLTLKVTLLTFFRVIIITKISRKERNDEITQILCIALRITKKTT